MSNNLLEDKKSIFKKVIQLADHHKLLINRANFPGGSISEIHEFEQTPAGQEIVKAHRALVAYMSTLELKDLMMLETVMYLGRDKDYDKFLTPSEIYDDYHKYISKQITRIKEAEINQLTEKVPLADYLRDGLTILDIAL
jgi:hypothetical protein